MKKDDFRQLRKNFTIFRCHIPILQRVGYIFFSPHFITLNSFSCHLIYIEYKGFTPFFLLSVSAFSFLGKRPCVQTKTHLRLRSNVLAFKIKRPCVSSQTHLRFSSNALAFWKSIEAKSFIVTSCSIEESPYMAI